MQDNQERRWFRCQEETVQDQPEEARELEEALDGVEVVAGWVAAVESERVENAYALIVAIELLIRQVPPATRLSALNVGHQWHGRKPIQCPL